MGTDGGKMKVKHGLNDVYGEIAIAVLTLRFCGQEHLLDFLVEDDRSSDAILAFVLESHKAYMQKMENGSGYVPKEYVISKPSGSAGPEAEIAITYYIPTSGSQGDSEAIIELSFNCRQDVQHFWEEVCKKDYGALLQFLMDRSIHPISSPSFVH